MPFPVLGGALMALPLVLSCLSSSLRAAEAPRQDINGGPTDVLVFSHEALVTRRQTVAVPAGRVVLQWRGLPASMQPGSMRVAIDGLAGVRIRSVRYDLLPVVGAEALDAAELEKQRAELDLEAKRIDDQRMLATATIKLLEQISFADDKDGEALELRPASWGEALDFVQAEVGTALDRLRALNERAEQVATRQQEVTQQLADLRAHRVPAEAAALIDIDVPTAGAAGVELVYGVGNVAWYPSYSFIVDAAGGRMEMVRSAWVGQNTGEDWDGVRLRFSTGEPHRLAVMPQLNAWTIGHGSVGLLEPIAAGSWEPLADTIVRPGSLAASRSLFTANPLARAIDVRLAEIFDTTGDGSLVKGRELADALAETGGPGFMMAIGAGGGAAGAFGSRNGGGRKRAVGRYGGSKASESAVEVKLRWLARAANNGNWGSGDQRLADTALAILSFLGAGYDHRTANRYQMSVKQGLDVLQSEVGHGALERSSLFAHAQVSMALAEAYAMTQDEDLRSSAQLAVASLTQRATSVPWRRHPSFMRRSWPDGPSNLAFAIGGLKSAKAAGLETSESAWLQMMAMVEEYSAMAKSPLDHAAVAYARVMLGFRSGDVALDEHIEAILRRLPVLRPGAFDHRFILLGTMACFQVGGETWQTWNADVRDALVNGQNKDGSWSPIGSDGIDGGRGGSGSRVYATSLTALALETYYRYVPVAPKSGGWKGDGRDAGQIHYIAPAISAGGRDDRFDALQAETLTSNGAYKLVPFERRQIPARFEHHAVPLAHHGAWLQAVATNDGATDLLPGEARLFDGTDFIGAVFLEHVAAGDELVVPLGLDPGVHLQRARAVKTAAVGFRGQTRRSDYRIAIGITNNLERPVTVIVRDRVPRPVDPRIRIEDLDFGKATPVYEPDSEDGEIRFTVPIAAGSAADIGFAYALEHPADVMAVEEGE